MTFIKLDTSQKNIGDHEYVHCVDPLYLIIGEVGGCTEVKNGNKYLIFTSTDKKKKGLKST